MSEGVRDAASAWVRDALRLGGCRALQVAARQCLGWASRAERPLRPLLCRNPSLLLNFSNRHTRKTPRLGPIGSCQPRERSAGGNEERLSVLSFPPSRRYLFYRHTKKRGKLYRFGSWGRGWFLPLSDMMTCISSCSL